MGFQCSLLYSKDFCNAVWNQDATGPNNLLLGMRQKLTQIELSRYPIMKKLMSLIFSPNKALEVLLKSSVLSHCGAKKISCL